MAATGNTFQSGLMKCMDGTIALLTDTIKIYLVKSTYTPNRDHDGWREHELPAHRPTE